MGRSTGALYSPEPDPAPAQYFLCCGLCAYQDNGRHTRDTTDLAGVARLALHVPSTLLVSKSVAVC